MTANPAATPRTEETFPSATPDGINSEQDTAIIAPAEKESAHGKISEITPTATAPNTPAAISTSPEN